MRRIWMLVAGMLAGWVVAGVAGEPEAAVAGGDSESVWAPNPCVAVFEGPDYSDQNNPTPVVRIVGAKNGWFTGQAVLFSKVPVKAPSVKMGDLTSKKGGRISGAAIEIFYAWPSGVEKNAHRRYPNIKKLARYDALVPVPRDEPARTHPVWLKIKVPADAEAGEYSGELELNKRKIPVVLSVADWKLPDPVDYVTHAGLTQSPDSVAMQYKVEFGSEAHWKLIGKSLELMGQIGNKIIFIPVLCRTHFGNENGMVRWVKDSSTGSTSSPQAGSGQAGGYKYDTKPAEQYLDLYIRTAGKPKIVCFYVWECYCGSSYLGKGEAKGSGPRVTLLDEATGKLETIEGPVEGTPEGEEFFRPVMKLLHEMLQKRGLGDETFMIGVAGDARPTKAVSDMFKNIAPEARWVLQSHGSGQTLNGVPFGYISHVWGTGYPPDPDAPAPHSWSKNYNYGWQNKVPRTVFPRFGGEKYVINPPLWVDAPLGVHRALGEASLISGLSGFGRIGADFWPCNGGAVLANRYKESNLGQLSITTGSASLLYPGTNGALPTIRFEMLREGVQECEAKVCIEKALTGKESRVLLGEERAKKYEELLKARIRVIRQSTSGLLKKEQVKGWEWYATESGWQDAQESLFAAAGEVAKVTAK